MNRRALLLTGLLAGCGLSERPYAERREWPLVVARPAALPPRVNGRTLELRTLRAGPGLESRGLQSLDADGAIRTEFYEEWSVPPAQAVEESLRQWLGGSGIFAGVVAPGSRIAADYVLEGDLGALWSEPAAGRADAALGITLITGDTPRVLLQRRYAETAVLAGSGPQAATQAMLAALAVVFARVEGDLRRAVVA
jgi:ABC-type uncharacterized transport system auxiliary subunit